MQEHENDEPIRRFLNRDKQPAPATLVSTSEERKPAPVSFSIPSPERVARGIGDQQTGSRFT